MFNSSNSMFSKLMWRHARALSILLGCYVLLLAFSAGSAWSFDQQMAQTKKPLNLSFDVDTSRLPSASANDTCLSLLKTLSHADRQSNASVDSARRSAGQAVALGLVFGVQFALDPNVKDRSVRPYVAMAPSKYSSKALAIADYRRCKNEQALKTLASLQQ